MAFMYDSIKERLERSGRFTNLAKLGKGSFGIVYKAFDSKYGSDLAIKVLTEPEGDALTRFRREFRTLVRIVHPNLVSLYEFFEGDGLRYYTMEYVKGANFTNHFRAGDSAVSDVNFNAATLKNDDVLDSRIETRRQPIARPTIAEESLREALIQLVEGVSALHRADILHRDIKPENVIVTSEEHQVMLLDFGLIHELLPAGRDLSRSGFLVGTLLYMSPEQIEGKKLTTASDWYAVGVMLYEALTGLAPIRGSSHGEIMRAKITSEPPRPSSLIAGVPNDLDELCHDLLRISPDERLTGDELLRRLGHTPSSEPASFPIPFLGRRSHLGQLNKALKKARKNQTIVACVKGNSGMGKSELVAQFISRIEQNEPDVLILKGRCLLQESVPYKSLSSLIDYLIRYLNKFYSTDEQAKLLPNDVSALVLLFEVFQELEAIRLKRRAVPEIPDQQELRRRAFAALREFFGRLCSKKILLIFIDDLQWGDADSVALFTELLRPFDPPTPLLLILAYRSDEIETSSLATLLPALEALPGVQVREIEVAELTDIEALDLAQAVIGEADDALAAEHAEIIARESKGIPFFVDWFAREADESGKLDGVQKLEERILLRVARLPNEERRFLEILAIAAKPLEIGIAMKAAELDLGKYRSITSQLLHRRMIRERAMQDENRFETYHDKFREAIIKQLSPEMRQNHHYRLAVALEDSKRADPETLAVHFTQAGDQQRAATYMEEAADQASKALAFDRAADLYQRATELYPQGGSGLRSRLRKQADALANAGRGGDAAKVYLSLIDEAKAIEALELRRLAAEQYLRSGRIDRGLAEIREVLNKMGMKLADTPTAALISIVARRAQVRLRTLKYKERDENQVPREELVRIDTCWSVAVGLTMVDVIHGSDFQNRHLLRALQAGEPSRVVRALAMEAAYAATAGRRAEARVQKILVMAMTLSQRLQKEHPEALGRTMVASGIAFYLMNYWKKSVEINKEATEILRQRCTGVDWERHLAQHFSLMSRVYLGKWDEITTILPGLLQEAQDRGDRLSVVDLRTRLSYITYLAADDLEGLQAELEYVIDGWSQKKFTTQHFYDLLRRGEIALYRGEALSAWEQINKKQADLYGSLLMWQIQPFRIESEYLRARCALASAIAEKTRDAGSQTVSKYVKFAEEAARKLRKERSPFAKALALLTQAGIDTFKGQNERAIEMLKQAEDDLSVMDMSLHEVVSRRRRGELIGGDEGQALVAAADEFMITHGIKNPFLVSNMLLPSQYEL